MNFFKRMRMPLSAFKADEMDKVIGAAKRCLNTPEGEILLKHLISSYGMDDQIGPNAGDYVVGQQDVIKYILGLTNDQ